VEVDLTPDQTAFIRQAIDAGCLRHPEDAVQEVLSLWEQRERRSLQAPAGSTLRIPCGNLPTRSNGDVALAFPQRSRRRADSAPGKAAAAYHLPIIISHRYLLPPCIPLLTYLYLKV
jgi:hypothetical protein